MSQPSDDRSSLAKAYGWAIRVMVVSLEMVLPGLAGYWLDTWLGSVALFTCIGLAIGGIAGVVHLLHMVRIEDRR